VTLVEILQGANVALRLIQERLVLVLCMLLTALLFGWAMWLQTVLGAIIAATWGLTIFLPVLIAGRGAGNNAPEAAQHPAPETQ
jgi:sugar phosphate permease